MKFSIMTLNDNGSGMKFNDKKELMKEIGLMIDDCLANGGKNFEVIINADASCFKPEEFNK